MRYFGKSLVICPTFAGETYEEHQARIAATWDRIQLALWAIERHRWTLSPVRSRHVQWPDEPRAVYDARMLLYAAASKQKRFPESGGYRPRTIEATPERSEGGSLDLTNTVYDFEASLTLAAVTYGAEPQSAPSSHTEPSAPKEETIAEALDTIESLFGPIASVSSSTRKGVPPPLKRATDARNTLIDIQRQVEPAPPSQNSQVVQAATSDRSALPKPPAK